MVPGSEQGEDHLAAGVVGIGDQDHHALERHRHREKEQDQAVELGPFVAVGPHDALADARYQRHGRRVAGRRAGQQRQALEAVAEDEWRLGVVRRLLVQLLDGGHLTPLLGRFEAVGEAHAVSPDGENREGIPAPTGPQSGEPVELEGRAVKEVQQAFVGGGGQP